MPKLFLSHSSRDKELVQELVELMVMGMKISQDDIYCTSLNGTIKTGSKFIENIKENLTENELVIFLITEDYLKSKFCLAELGAAWGLNQNIYPLIVNPIKIDDLNDTPLRDVEMKVLNNKDDIAIIYDELKAEGIAKDNTSAFNSKLEKFMEYLTSQEKRIDLLPENNNTNSKVSNKKKDACNNFFELLRESKEKFRVLGYCIVDTPHDTNKFNESLGDYNRSIRVLLDFYDDYKYFLCDYNDKVEGLKNIYDEYVKFGKELNQLNDESKSKFSDYINQINKFVIDLSDLYIQII